VEIYLHKQGAELQLIQVEETMTVEELIAVHGPGEGGGAWIEDVDEILETEITLIAAGVPERGHVHVSRCHKIDVRVRYGGDSKSKEFPPSATIARVFKWATGKEEFDLTPTERAKHTLAICDSQTQPDKSEHVGSLASDCGLCLDLAPKERFEG
jgi:hypothetical protein